MDSSNIVIRPMEFSDASDVAELCGELGYPVTPAEIEGRLMNIRQLPPEQPAEILVAWNDGLDRVVAWVHVCVPTFLANGQEGAIWGLVVASTHRGHGLGHAMMNAAETWAVTHGCSVMRLTSGSRRPQAHAFYEHLGYETVKTQHVFSRMLPSEDIHEDLEPN